MDRIFAVMARPLWLLLALMFSTQAFCGVVLVTPDPERPLSPGESYPDSRFGDHSPISRRGGQNFDDDSEKEEDQLFSTRSGPQRRVAGENDSSRSLRVKPPTDVAAEKLLENGPSALARKGVQEVALIAGDLGFFPKTVFLTRDVPVRMFITGASKNTLCIMMDSFQVRRQIRSQKIEEITFTPHFPGKYRFYCPVNGMEGALVVRELASSLPSGLSSGASQ